MAEENKGQVLDTPVKKSNFRKIISIIFKIVSFTVVLYAWLIYAYSTLDRSEEALQKTAGTGPLPDRFSFLILAAIVGLFFRKSIFSRSKGFGSIISKIIFTLIFILGIIIFFQ